MIVFSENGENAKNLSAMEASLFNVCLDSGAVTKPSAKDAMSNLAHQSVWGGGSDSNSINRWYDKSLQVSDVFIGAARWMFVTLPEIRLHLSPCPGCVVHPRVCVKMV